MTRYSNLRSGHTAADGIAALRNQQARGSVRGVSGDSEHQKAPASNSWAFQWACQCCIRHGIQCPFAEYRFHDVRRWRFDFAWLEARVALEIEGATWTGGRHTRGKGFSADCEKYGQAASMGWVVIRCTTEQFQSGEAFGWVTGAIRARAK